MKNNTKKVECAGGIIFNQKNEVVIVNQNHDSWSLPKGQRDDLSELKTIHIFLFKSEQEKLKPLDKNNPEAKWVDIHEVENYLTHKEDIKFFKENIRLVIN